MQTIDIEGVQQQIVAIVVEGAQLRHKVKCAEETAAGTLRGEIDKLRRAAERINTSIFTLYNLLPCDLLPTAATLQAIEQRDKRFPSAKIEHRYVITRTRARRN